MGTVRIHKATKPLILNTTIRFYLSVVGYKIKQFFNDTELCCICHKYNSIGIISFSLKKKSISGDALCKTCRNKINLRIECSLY